MDTKYRPSIRVHQSTKERFLESRKDRDNLSPPRTRPWWSQRSLFYTLLSLALAVGAGFAVRGLYRFFPQLGSRPPTVEHYQPVGGAESKEMEMPLETAKRLFSGEISGVTKTESQ
ncbi:MAG TPA: hypothetical protein PLZ55_09965 [bacterium]|nr:hypothetical protein [bacterium]HPO08981.1 hypothetical protein [bacterium]HQO33271.1 hypothetical protein [bacterium]HQP99206.1 hypothetical protein [bacterium]